MSEPEPPEPGAAITVEITQEDADELRRLRQLTGLPKVGLASRSIQLYGFVYDELTCGSTIRLTRANGVTLLVELS